MRILKCYLANNSKGRFVTSREAAEGVTDTWTCPSCGCVLVLHSLYDCKDSWFEHDQSTVPASTLMNCTHLDPEIKAEIRRRKLRNIINGLDIPVAILSWYCVWCGQHYQGDKLCIPCGTGIYSIEYASWQANYR